MKYNYNKIYRNINKPFFMLIIITINKIINSQSQNCVSHSVNNFKYQMCKFKTTKQLCLYYNYMIIIFFVMALLIYIEDNSMH